MAKDFWHSDTNFLDMNEKAADLVKECERQSENCLYTSTSLFIWLRILRYLKVFFVLAPLVLGSLASWKLLTGSTLESVKGLTSICSFLAGLLPSMYAALKLDDSLARVGLCAAEFKNLQDRFRQVALIGSKKSVAEFEADFKSIMDRMEAARKPSVTAPECIFKWAQRKVKSGDYSFDTDMRSGSAD